MMHNRNAKWVAVIVLVVAGAALLAFAQAESQNGNTPPGHGGMWKDHAMGDGMFGPGMGHHFLMGMLAKQLDLTDAQKAQIKTMWEAEKPTVTPLLQSLANGHKQMLDLTANGAFDEAKVRAVATQQSQTIAQLIVEKEKMLSAVYTKVLTADQKTKMDQMRQHMETHIDHMLQHMTAAAPQGE
jgi:Spy/CpxP family protein refolding chaperone